MLTLAEIIQYEAAFFFLMIIGAFIFFFGLYKLVTKKDRDTPDTFFFGTFIVMGIFCMTLFFGFAINSNIISETITPCSISDEGGLVASVENGIYNAESTEMLKLHINQTREVRVMNAWLSRYPNIIEVPGVNCPSGAASRC